MRDLSLHLIDIIQNSVSAKASRVSVRLTAFKSNNKLILEIADNGVGMDEAFAKSVIDPFVTTRTTRKIGLGIPLLKASAERAGGSFDISSVRGNGTTLTASFEISNIDRLPLGDIAETVSNIVTASPDIDIDVTLSSDMGKFDFDTAEVKKQLGGVPINEFEVISWIKKYIDEGIKNTFGGVLNEIDS